MFPVGAERGEMEMQGRDLFGVAFRVLGVVVILFGVYAFFEWALYAHAGIGFEGPYAELNYWHGMLFAPLGVVMLLFAGGVTRLAYGAQHAPMSSAGRAMQPRDLLAVAMRVIGFVVFISGLFDGFDHVMSSMNDAPQTAYSEAEKWSALFSLLVGAALIALAPLIARLSRT